MGDCEVTAGGPHCQSLVHSRRGWELRAARQAQPQTPSITTVSQLGQSAGSDETEMLIYKGRVLTASRVTSRVTVPVQKRLQAF